MNILLQSSLFLFLTCFRQEGLGSEIINGYKVKDNKVMQYMASVQNKKGHVCGGFLVSEDFVMTAAHCDDSTTLTVVLGTHNLKTVRNTMIYRTKKCKHPRYRKVITGNDIMLLKLLRKRNIGSQRHQIKPVRIPSHPKPPAANTKCIVAGWGFTETGGGSVDELYATNVPVIDWKKCNRLWSNILPPNVTCAGGYNSDKGFCQGDSGGPLVCGNTAVGIVSFNHNSTCDYPDLPNVYTDVSKYLPWVNHILRKKTC